MSRFPGLPKRNPGLELANAFSVIHFLISLLKGSVDFLCKAPHRRSKTMRRAKVEAQKPAPQQLR
jgi:hypothetical protein